MLRKNGILVSIISPPSQEKATQYGVRITMLGNKPNAAQLKEIAQLIDSGKLYIHIQTVLPLSEARQAHQMSQSGRTRAKIVLQVIDEKRALKP